MVFRKKYVVVVGAPGVVGSGVVRKYLDAGATVIGVSRRGENLEDLKKSLAIDSTQPFLGVVGDFATDDAADEAGQAVAGAVDGNPIDHVVSAQGFVAFAEDPTETPVSTLKAALEDGFYNNFLAAKTFLPAMKTRHGASLTLVSGGLAHAPPPVTAVWLGTVKNAALNALGHALTAETSNDRVRVNTMCIHFNIAPAGDNKNQAGLEAEGDTLRLAPAFLAVAQGARKGQLIGLDTWADVETLISSP